MLTWHLRHLTALKAAATCGVLGICYLQPLRPMVFDGGSMEPTYRNRSVVFTTPVQPQELHKGDVVVIDMPTGPIVKRIAFMPGDKILRVWFKGYWMDMVFVRPSNRPEPLPSNWGLFTVPSDTVYVLGDNSNVSDDSRHFGCVPMALVRRKLVDQRP